MNKKAFSKRLTTILNFGALNLAMALGYRTRLFDVMDGFELPQTASAIAEKAGLNERYVNEWLGVMVSGDIVELISKSFRKGPVLSPKGTWRPDNETCRQREPGSIHTRNSALDDVCH